MMLCLDRFIIFRTVCMNPMIIFSQLNIHTVILKGVRVIVDISKCINIIMYD